MRRRSATGGSRARALSEPRREIAFVSHVPGGMALELLKKGPDAVAARLLHHACDETALY